MLILLILPPENPAIIMNELSVQQSVGSRFRLMAGTCSARFLCCTHAHKATGLDPGIKSPVLDRSLHHVHLGGFQSVTFLIIRRLLLCFLTTLDLFSCNYRHQKSPSTELAAG